MTHPSEIAELIQQARASLELVGDGDWTPQDAYAVRLADALEASEGRNAEQLALAWDEGRGSLEHSALRGPMDGNCAACKALRYGNPYRNKIRGKK